MIFDWILNQEKKKKDKPTKTIKKLWRQLEKLEFESGERERLNKS